MVKSIHGHSAPEATRDSSAPDLMDPGPDVALLSNGRYSVMVTAAGAGWGTWRDLDVTRWREDVTRDCWGQFCYVRDQRGQHAMVDRKATSFSDLQIPTSTLFMETGPISAVVPKTSKFPGKSASHQMPTQKCGS